MPKNDNLAYVKARVSKEAHQAIKTIVDREGMTLEDVMHRVMTWFARQGRPMQKYILSGMTADELAEVAKKAQETEQKWDG